LNSNIIQGKVSNELSDYIYNAIVSDQFGWYWNEKQIYASKPEDQMGGFTHAFYNSEGAINSSFSSIVPYLLKELENVINIEYAIRAQANLVCNIFLNEEQNKNNVHIDDDNEDFFTILYYVITSDGNTVIYNEDTSSIEVSPIKGNYVIFPSNTLHKPNPPVVNKKRIVINIVFKGKLKQ